MKQQDHWIWDMLKCLIGIGVFVLWCVMIGSFCDKCEADRKENEELKKAVSELQKKAGIEK